MVSALYPGSFDPVTRGHLDLIERALPLFDHLTVAVAINSSKASTFTAAERVDMLREVLPKDERLSVTAFQGLVVDFCKSQGIGAVLRGVRTVSDFEYEYQMALTNRTFAQDIETMFVMTHEEYSFVSSRLIKEAAALGGDVGSFVPREVEKWLKRKFGSETKSKKKE